eukprot:2311231-Prymnesium_polylepis.1
MLGFIAAVWTYSVTDWRYWLPEYAEKYAQQQKSYYAGMKGLETFRAELGEEKYEKDYGNAACVVAGEDAI